MYKFFLIISCKYVYKKEHIIKNIIHITLKNSSNIEGASADDLDGQSAETPSRRERATMAWTAGGPGGDRN